MTKSAFFATLIAFALRAQVPPSPDFIRPDPAAPVPAPLAQALDRLGSDPIAAHIGFLSHPDREGRGLGTRGLQVTARYVIRALREAGLRPAHPAGYVQSVPLREVRDLDGSLTLRAGSSRWKGQAGKACVMPGLAPQILSGPLTFAAYGIQEEALGWDDFKGLEIRGRVVILIGGLPPEPRWQTPEWAAKYAGARPEDRYDARLESLGRLGARAAIALERGLGARLAREGRKAGPVFLAHPEAPAPEEPPLIRVDLDALAPWLATQGIALDEPRSRDLSGTAQLRVSGRLFPARSPNVIARLEGADPALKAEAVVIGAHLDHLGKPGGVLHPGADDNASGVAALLEIAKALAAAPHRRTILFAFWTGEEDGKFGSGHYVRHPLWPLERTAAYLNLDMIGHPWTVSEIRKLAEDCRLEKADAFLDGLPPGEFAEPGVADWASEPARALVVSAHRTRMAIHLDRTDGRNGGSDYRDFARRRIPFVRFFGSYFPAYHQPGDTLANLDPAQVHRMARLALAAAWELTNR